MGVMNLRKWKVFWSDRRKLLLLMCVLFSSFFWLLAKLSATYQRQIVWEMKLSQLPLGKFVDPDFRLPLAVEVKASGFSLLRHYFDSSDKYLEFKWLKRLKSGSYELSEQYEDQVKAECFPSAQYFKIYPSAFDIALRQKKKKKVPVVFLPDVSYRKEYQLTDLMIRPDSITIFGMENVIDTISGIYVRGKKYKNMDSSFEEMYELTNTELLEYGESLIRVQGFVSKISEQEMRVPIRVIHMPSGWRIKLFPSETRLLCMGALVRLKSLKPSDFTVVADYNQRTDTHIPLQVKHKPQDVKVSFLSEKEVEFLVKDK